jgi:hypothetical protein
VQKERVMNPEMFREYDIRGIAGKDMTEDDVVLIGKGVGSFLRENGCSKLTVGRDCQPGVMWLTLEFVPPRFFIFQFNILMPKAG